MRRSFKARSFPRLPTQLSNPFPPKSFIKDPLQPPNLFYRGSSMRGTFKPGDKLVIENVPFDQIRKGDLVIFNRACQEKGDFIVHRVSAITSNGLVTRGDNCIDQDKELIGEKHIVGRVIQYDRRGRIRRARNGRMGQIRATLLYGRLHGVKWLKIFLRKPYVMFRKTGIIARIWQPDIEAVYFETPDGPLLKYLHHGRTVAICLKIKNRWKIKRPYDFIMQTELN